MVVVLIWSPRAESRIFSSKPSEGRSTNLLLVTLHDVDKRTQGDRSSANCGRFFGYRFVQNPTENPNGAQRYRRIKVEDRC